ncbi:MAG TPA: hypothetical protein VHR17_16750 [Thermoanaerobaculia bacterium]|nr:hypothetical protein [Thermoanaerobaculia bacterium]
MSLPDEQASPTERPPVARRAQRTLRAWQVWAITFAIAAPLLAAFFTRNPQLYDNDAYYHLAVARTYFREGLIDDLRWTRFSAMADGFGDKELLFHLLLAPFAGLARDPVRGGQIALTLLLAALFAALSVAARRTLGGWAILLPWAIAFSSTELAWRWVRLRPELLSLLLLVCALEAIARRRYRLLGAIAALYALSYTAFHAFVGLCGLIFLFGGWARRRWEWPLPLYAAAGTAVGLLVHPHFPKNLEIWVLQTFEYFRYRAVLDVGTEITPNYTDVTLMVNLGWALGLCVLWLSSRPDPTAETRPSDADLDRRLADAYGVAAAVFSVLYLLMSRFSLYALPFATLWVLDSIRARGRSIGGRTRLPWSRRAVPLALGAAFCLAVSAPEALRQWKNYDLRTQAGPGRVRLRDREAFSAALPPGALVAAPWQQTSIYMLWAPQALYLNVLDPVFLAASDPARHAAQASVFSGEEPDVPLAVAVALDSQFLAYSPYAGLDLLTARLEHDPRVAIRHRLHGFNLLWTMLPDRNDAFILDWFELPSQQGEAPPTAAKLDAATLRRYPRWPVGRGTRVEAYVDTRRLDDRRGCVTLAHPIAESEPRRMEAELAPWGPSTVGLDGNEVAGIGGEPKAVLGRGVTFVLELAAGDHLLTVRTCPGKDEKGPRGFYLRRVD